MRDSVAGAAAIVSPWATFLLVPATWGWGTPLMIIFGLGPIIGLLMVSVSEDEWTPVFDGEREENPTGTFVAGLSTFVAVFSWAYWVLSSTSNAFNPGPLRRIDAVYFTLTTLTTTGFGDISPRSPSARLLVSVQMLLGILILIIGLARVVNGVRPQFFRVGAKPTGGGPPQQVVPNQLDHLSHNPTQVQDEDDGF